jgi:hypothetical protein
MCVYVGGWVFVYALVYAWINIYIHIYIQTHIYVLPTGPKIVQNGAKWSKMVKNHLMTQSKFLPSEYHKCMSAVNSAKSRVPLLSMSTLANISLNWSPSTKFACACACS